MIDANQLWIFLVGCVSSPSLSLCWSVLFPFFIECIFFFSPRINNVCVNTVPTSVCVHYSTKPLQLWNSFSRNKQAFLHIRRWISENVGFSFEIKRFKKSESEWLHKVIDGKRDSQHWRCALSSRCYFVDCLCSGTWGILPYFWRAVFLFQMKLTLF